MPVARRPATLVATLVLLAAGVAPLQAQRADEPGRRAAAEAPDGENLADEFGGDEACLQRARQIRRLLDSRFGQRFLGPEPDLKDIAYGSQPRQRLDVFLARGGAKPAPVLVMVHGGGWCVGDKGLAAVTRAKSAHWTGKGLVFVSVNYPMIPDGARALQQAESVARAVAHVQQHAAEWGGDPARVVLMGHSAGAHLVSLVNADATLRAAAGVKPLLGVVSLDSGATNTVTQMSKAAPKLRERYAEAFGSSEAGWIAASPFHRLERGAAPWLGVCSSRRADDPCEQTRQYAEKSNGLGIRAVVLPVDKRHGAVNKDLGDDAAFTEAVDRFLGGLDPVLAARLAARP